MVVLDPGLDFEESTHTYRFGGQVVPSVTQILAPLANLSFVDPDVLEAARAFGTAVHKACELDDLGTLDEDELDPALGPYLSAWRKFCREYEVRWDMVEMRVFHKQLRYAGTLDRFGTVRLAPHLAHRTPAMVDIKSGTQLFPSVGPQLAAYHRAVPTASVTTKRLAVQLKPDGTYFAKWHDDPNDFAVFASLLTISNWCGKHGITPHYMENRNVRT
jgi:hypothetical protein